MRMEINTVQINPCFSVTYLDKGHERDDAVESIGHAIPLLTMESVNETGDLELSRQIATVFRLQIDTHQLFHWPVHFVRIDGTQEVDVNNDDHLTGTVDAVEDARPQWVEMAEHDRGQHGRVEWQIGGQIGEEECAHEIVHIEYEQYGSTMLHGEGQHSPDTLTAHMFSGSSQQHATESESGQCHLEREHTERGPQRDNIVDDDQCEEETEGEEDNVGHHQNDGEQLQIG